MWLANRSYSAGRIGVTYYQSNAFVYHYELGDHLGDVRAVITRNPTTGLKELKSYTDYYPFGWELPGRTYSSSENYRYGFQGQYAEKDPETNWNSFELRSYDGRVGRWMNPDPYEQYWNPYLAFGNAPHQTVDPDGGFDRWIGAFIYKVFNGGTISRSGDFWQVANSSGVYAGRLGGGFGQSFKEFGFGKSLNWVEHNFGFIADNLEGTQLASTAALARGATKQRIQKGLYDLGTIIRDKTPVGPINPENGKKIRPFSPNEVLNKYTTKVANLSKVVGKVATVLTVTKIGYDVITDKHNISTWIDVAVLGLSIVGGPVGIGIAVGYGVADYVFGLNNQIDTNFGYR